MICYIILIFSAIDKRDNVILQSEMYHDIFFKANVIQFGLKKIDIKRMTDKLNRHTYS